MSNEKLDKSTKELFDLWKKRKSWDATEKERFKRQLTRTIQESLFEIESIERDLMELDKLNITPIVGSTRHRKDKLLITNSRQIKLLSIAYLAK